MQFKINEKWVEESEISIYALRRKYKENADIIVLNGFPIKEDKEIKENDRLVFIKRGQTYTEDELKELIRARHTPLIAEKLEKAKIVICGVGGLGSNIAVDLCRIGIGEIKIIDFDIVEPSNLNRQQYFIENIGMRKVTALKENLKRINPFVKVVEICEKITEQNIEVILGTDELIIEAFDDPKSKVMITNYILKKEGSKLICGSGMAGYYKSNDIKTKKVFGRVYICGDLEKEASEGEGLMAPRVSICAGHMSNVATRIILGEEEV